MTKKKEYTTPTLTCVTVPDLSVLAGGWCNADCADSAQCTASP